MGNEKTGDWFETRADVENELCPQCAAVMTSDAVLCMSCGFNRVSGKFVDIAPAPIAKPAARAPSMRWTLILIAIFLCAACVYVFYEPILAEQGHRLPQTLSERLPKQLKRPLNPRWLRELNQSALIAVFEDRIAARLAETHPPYETGETITLTSTSGKTGQGVFAGVDEHHALLEAGGKTVSIPFITLEEDCRLRADIPGRAIYVHKSAQARAMAYFAE